MYMKNTHFKFFQNSRKLVEEDNALKHIDLPGLHIVFDTTPSKACAQMGLGTGKLEDRVGKKEIKA